MSDSPLRKVRRPEGLREALPGLRRLVPHVRPHLRRQRTLIAGGGAALSLIAGYLKMVTSQRYPNGRRGKEQEL